MTRENGSDSSYKKANSSNGKIKNSIISNDEGLQTLEVPSGLILDNSSGIRTHYDDKNQQALTSDDGSAMHSDDDNIQETSEVGKDTEQTGAEMVL